jgi:hypothetical protein
MFNWLMFGMIILGIGVAMLVINKNFDIGRWFSLLSSFFILGGTGIATAGVLNAIRRGTSLVGMRLPNKKSLLPTNSIAAELPSITERTTQLIPAEDTRTNRVQASQTPE